jgi:hypothetical protein
MLGMLQVLYAPSGTVHSAQGTGHRIDGIGHNRAQGRHDSAMWHKLVPTNTRIHVYLSGKLGTWETGNFGLRGTSKAARLV